jgi:hypothetical protein
MSSSTAALFQEPKLLDVTVGDVRGSPKFHGTENSFLVPGGTWPYLIKTSFLAKILAPARS